MTDREADDSVVAREQVARILADFLEESHYMEPGAVADAALLAGEAIGALELTVHLVDAEQRTLVPLVPPDGESQPVENSLAGRAFITGELLQSAEGDHHRVWAPLIDGAERVGVFGCVVEDIDDAMRGRCLTLASLITEFLVAKGQYTDVYKLATRTREMSLAAEMQWRLVPPLTCSTRRFGIAAVLEPAYDIGGDAFDYAINGDIAHVAIVDAMGHGLDATWPATLALGSLRHSRLRGLDPVDSYVAASEVLQERFGSTSFVTADIATLDVETGRLRWVNAGHPPPLHVRAGQVVGELHCEPSLPLGLGEEVADVGEIVLEPWDRVLFFSDGVTEGRTPGHEPFGAARLADVLERESLSGAGPAETMRRLSRAILDHGRHQLDDDFTLLCVEYRHHEATPEPLTARMHEEETL